MGDLAKAVAKLEEQVEDVRMLRQIVERLDMEIAGRMDEIETIGGAVLDLHGDLDNQIAEHDYMAVEQSVASLRRMVDVEEVLPAIDTVLLLTALRDGESLPDLTLPLSAFEKGDAGEQTGLTQEDLDRDFKADLAKAEQRWEEIWGDHDWTDSDERDSHQAEHRAESEREAIKDRARRAAAQVEEIVDHIGDTLWPDLVEAVEAGDRGRAVRALAEACAAARETEAAYKLYEVNLSVQYESSPMSLGPMGEYLTGLEAQLGLPEGE
ncbi:hypothetical protein OIE43_19820 [Streptomyces pseudovenezuelae]|uniref:hypothetical protein n=1 Tax=Streptomyces pseudovenezuelae TaxID=67350 RepID=UPI002E2F3E87|nr:hypothetical protein [Streptomyces pseudovenezuelae]